MFISLHPLRVSWITVKDNVCFNHCCISVRMAKWLIGLLFPYVLYKSVGILQLRFMHVFNHCRISVRMSRWVNRAFISLRP